MRAAVLLPLLLTPLGCKAASRQAPAPLVIVTVADGLSADEVERQVTIPLERALAPRAREVRSTSVAGVSRVAVWMGANAQARQEAISAVASAVLPDGVSPTLMPEKGPVPPVRYLLNSEQLPRADVRALQDWELERLARSTPGVLDAEACGGSPREVRVDVDMKLLAAHRVSLAQVMSALTRAGTAVTGSSAAFTVRGAQARAEDLIRAPLALREGVTLQDVATLGLRAANETCSVEVDGDGSVVEGVVSLRNAADWQAVEPKLRTALAPRGVELRLWPPASAAGVLSFRVGISAPSAPGELARVARALSEPLRKRAEVASVLVERRAGVDLEEGLPGELQVLVALKAKGEERELAEALAEVAGVRYALMPASPRARLFSADVEHLEQTASKLAQSLTGPGEFEGSNRFRVSALSEHAPTLHVTPDRARLARSGVSLGDVQELIGIASGGRVVTQALSGPAIIDVRVTLQPPADSPEKLSGVPVALPDGGQVPLGQLARVEAVSTPVVIQRKDGQRFVELGVEVAPEFRGRVAELVRLGPGERIEWTTER